MTSLETPFLVLDSWKHASDVVQQWLLLLVAGAAALAAIYWSRQRQGRKQQLRLPPGPKGWPLFGNLGLLTSKERPRHQVLDSLAKEYGPIMFLRLGSKPGIVISSPEVAKEVLKTYDKEFASRPHVTVAHTMSYGEDSIPFSSYSPHWRFLRRIVTQELLSLQRVQQFEAVRAEETSRMIRSILVAGRGQGSASAAPLDMNRRSFYLVMNMLTGILMSKRFFDDSALDPQAEAHDLSSSGSQDEVVALEFKDMIEEVFFLASVPIIGDFIPALGFLDRIKNYKAAMLRAHDRYDTFCNSVVEEHRRQRQMYGPKAEKDFVDIMLSLPGENGAENLEENVIKSLLMNMLNAGTDTSSSSIEWGLSELLRHPDVLRKVHQELDSVVGKDRVVTEADLPSLPYFQAVVKEVFRLHPPGPLLVPHLNPEPCRVAGYDVPAGTITFINVWSICRNSQWWDEPLRFRPERFLGTDIDVRGKHFELLTFGTGRRGCPGMHLGIAVVQQTLARLVHSFDWSLPPGVEPQDLDMSEKYSITLPRATPLLAFAQPRLARHLY